MTMTNTTSLTNRSDVDEIELARGDNVEQSLPLLVRDDHEEPSVFLAQNLLREGRRQRGLPIGTVPSVCLLDPDGDIVRYLDRDARAPRSPSWACYHTELVETTLDGETVGIIGCAVGAPFAVLVAEQLFASGCALLLSITSAGRIADDLPHSSIIAIDRALRGDGTSYAYLPPTPWVEADVGLIETVRRDLCDAGIETRRGMTWTTDAPFRETATALAAAAEYGAIAVEMESAALYAYAHVSQRPIVCFAQVTNELAVNDGDFEKGPHAGAEAALAMVAAIARGWRSRQEEHR